MYSQQRVHCVRRSKQRGLKFLAARKSLFENSLSTPRRKPLRVDAFIEWFIM